MAELTKKQQRIIQRALKSLFQLKSFVIPKSIKDLPMKDPLSREVRLADNRRIYLSDEGIASIKTIVGTIEDGNLFDGLADYGEIWTACWRILEGALSGGREPETSSDLLEMVRERVSERIAVHTFAVSLFGVTLNGIDSITLGSTTITPSPLPCIESAGIEHKHAKLEDGIDSTKSKLWLISSATGTPRRAEERFRERAELVAGMSAAVAATAYRRGASAFRIGVAMSRDAVGGRSTWFSWDHKKQSLMTHHDLGHQQDFKIDLSLAETLTTTRLYTRAFGILESLDRTEL